MPAIEEERRELAPAISVRAILHILFRRKWLIAAVFLFASVVATGVLQYLDRPRYEAAAQLLVSPAAVQLPADGHRFGPAPAPDERVARTMQLLEGRSLAEQVLDRIGLQVLYPDLADARGDPGALRERALSRFARNLSVSAGLRSSILSVEFTHENPTLAAAVPNLIGKLYVDRYLNVARQPKVDEFFEEQLALRRQRRAASEEALRAFRQRHSISGSIAEEFKAASAELETLRLGLAESRAREAELRRQLGELDARLAADSRIPRSHYRLKARLSELQAEEGEMAISLSDEHPKLREVRDRIAGLQDRLDSDGVRSPYGSEEEQEQFNVQAQVELSRLRGELEAARARQAALSARLDPVRARVQGLAGVDLEFGRLQAQVDANEQEYRLYLGKLDDLRSVSASDEENLVGIRVIEEARVPFAPVDSRMGQKIALGLVASAGLAVGAAVLLQLARGRVETVEQVERLLDLPVLATIPELGARKMLALPRPERPGAWSG